MADETIQDDHPVIPPVSVPKPSREPVTIEGDAIDVTPVEARAPAPEPEAQTAPETAEPLVADAGSIPEAVVAGAAHEPEPVVAHVENAHEHAPVQGHEPALETMEAEPVVAYVEPAAAEAETAHEHEPALETMEPEPVVAHVEPAAAEAETAHEHEPALETMEPEPILADVEPPTKEDEHAPVHGLEPVPGATEPEALMAHDEPVAVEAEPAHEPEIALATTEPEPVAAAVEPTPVVTKIVPPEVTSPPPPAPPPQKPSSAAAFVAGGVGALLGAAVAFGATFLYPPGSNSQQTASTLDSALSSEVSARKTLDARLAELEAKAAQPAATSQPAASGQVSELEARLAKLESSAAKVDALAAVAAEAKAAHASADTLAASVASLGTGTSGGAPASGPNPEIIKLIADEQTLSDRLTKLEAQLDAVAHTGADAGKLASDQQALADHVAKLQAAIDAVKTSPGPDPALAKLSGDQQALAAQLGKLEAAVEAVKVPPAPDPALAKLAGDENALSDRLAKLEATLVATKAEIRADREVGPKGDPVAQSVAAIALERRLLAGQPYPVEYAALEKLGAPADALAALKPFAASGAPTTSALAASFAQLAPALAAPEKTAAHGDYAETLWGEVKGLVKVRQVGEIKGDDPAAVTTQVAGALARGDLGAARAAFAKLPEAERASASAWSKDADGVASARTAALSLVETSLSHLGDPKK